jgi:hypothetical protein
MCTPIERNLDRSFGSIASLSLEQQGDRDSYVSERNWRPTLPTRSGRVTGDFRMVDFVAFAGVDPAHRGQ